jgi:hypothetical protein
VGSNPTQGMNVWYVFSYRHCDELITRLKSPAVCKMIMKLNKIAPRGL